MQVQIKPTVVRTSVSLLLPMLVVMFNSFTFHNKSKVYNEKDASETIIPSSIHQFGQTRWQNNQQKTVHTIAGIEQLFEYDWSNYTLKTVVIDPGHGGKDKGTISADGVQEKSIALSISKKLGDFITASYPEVKVIYTRTTDKFIPLRKRADIANSNKADLFISIHCNSFRKSSVKGTETYVMGLHRAEENMEIIKRENDVVKLEENYESEYEEYGVDRNSPLYDILMNSYQNAFLEQSLSFAELVETKLKAKGHQTRGVHQAGFLVLRRTAMPSVLVETGYLTNSSDKAILTSAEGQSDLAGQLYYAFSEYKSRVESNKTGPLKKETAYEVPAKAVVVNNVETAENQDIVFGIQLASVEQKLTLAENKWRRIKNRLVVEESKDGLIRYLIKDFGTDYAKAKEEKKKLKAQGFTGCFVVAFKKGQRIELYKAKKALGLN